MRVSSVSMRLALFHSSVSSVECGASALLPSQRGLPGLRAIGKGALRLIAYAVRAWWRHSVTFDLFLVAKVTSLRWQHSASASGNRAETRSMVDIPS